MERPLLWQLADLTGRKCKYSKNSYTFWTMLISVVIYFFLWFSPFWGWTRCLLIKKFINHFSVSFNLPNYKCDLFIDNDCKDSKFFGWLKKICHSDTFLQNINTKERRVVEFFFWKGVFFLQSFEWTVKLFTSSGWNIRGLAKKVVLMGEWIGEL